MKLFAILLLFIISDSLDQQSCIIQHITVKYIDWSIVRSSPIPVSAFWSDNDNPKISNIRTLEIKNPELLKSFKNIIDSLVNLTESKGNIDTRISFLLRYENCPADTISIGRTNEVKFNSHSFELNKRILSHFSSIIPDEQLELINLGLKNK
jgi:hypothetical protein